MLGKDPTSISQQELFAPLSVDFHWALNTFPPLIGAADRIRTLARRAGDSLPAKSRDLLLDECNFIINKSVAAIVELHAQLKEERPASQAPDSPAR